MTRSFRDIEQYQNGASITNSSATLTLGTLITGRGLAGEPAPYTLVIEKGDGTNREVVNVNSTASFPQLGIDRGLNGTAAVSHDTTELVTMLVGENDLANFAQLDGGLQAGTINLTGGFEVNGVPVAANGIAYGPAPSGDTTGATDTTSLQAALNAFPSTGGILRLQPGTYYITSLTVSKPTTIIGCGGADFDLAGAVTTVVCTSATANAIAVTAKPFEASYFHLKNGAVSTPTAGAGIAFTVSTAASGAMLDHLTITGFWINLDVQYGYGWTLTNTDLQDMVQYGLRVQDIDNPDYGNSIVSNCSFFAGPNHLTPPALIRWQSGGAIRIIASKFNVNGTAVPVKAIDLAVADGAATGDINILGCSIENMGQKGIHAHLAGPSNTGTFRNVLIVGNQLQLPGSTVAVSITPEVSGKLVNVLLSGNIIDVATTGYDLANVDTVVIGSTVYQVVTTEVHVGSGVTNLTQSSSSVATTTALGTVEVDNNSGGTPIAITEAGYLSSITALTNSNIAAGAAIAPTKLGSGEYAGTDFKTSGLTGATTTSRYAGATSGGAPVSGTFAVGDMVLDVVNARVYICTTAGTPGTWAAAGGGMTNPMTTPNDLIIGGTAGAPARLASIASRSLQTDASGNILWSTIPSGGSATLAGDSDVTISSPVLANLLRHNGTSWVNYAFDKVQCHNAAAFSIPNNALTAITFDTNDFDTDTMHSTTTNSSRITIQKAGDYLVGGTVEFAASTAGIRLLALRKNGAGLLYGNVQPATAQVGVTASSTSHPFHGCIVGDYFELVADQTSGGSLSTDTSNGAGTTAFWATQIP